MNNNIQRYPIVMRLLHWLMALLILSMIASGWYMAGLDKEVSYKYDIYFWHKSFGVMIIFLIIARILFRFTSQVPALPGTLPVYEIKLAHFTHGLLYLLMILVPLSGYLMSDKGGHDIPFFGWVMPDLVDTNKEHASFLHEIHVLIPYILLGIIGLHLAGVIKHRFFDKPEHDSLKRML